MDTLTKRVLSKQIQLYRMLSCISVERFTDEIGIGKATYHRMVL